MTLIYVNDKRNDQKWVIESKSCLILKENRGEIIFINRNRGYDVTLNCM